MKKSKVFFAPAKKGSLYHYLEKLAKKVRLAQKIKKGEIVALKIHFGDYGNTTYLRPTFIKKLVEIIKSAGGEVFLTDTTTLYQRARHSLFGYLETARNNGFTPEVVGCPILIADGFKNSGTRVKLEKFLLLKEVKIAQLIYEADVLISAAHLTLHHSFAPAGTIKNIGMGCVTKETKLKIHTQDEKPKFDKKKCRRCGRCLEICPTLAFEGKNHQIIWHPDRCFSCGECIAHCPQKAIQVNWSRLSAGVQAGVLDVYQTILTKFTPQKIVHFNFAIDITPHCDCLARSSLPFVPDIGILASTDGLAIDKASADLITQSVGYPGSAAEEKKVMKAGKDKFSRLVPAANPAQYWQTAQKLKIGTTEYQLETVSL